MFHVIPSYSICQVPWPVARSVRLKHYEKAIQMASTDGPGRMGTKGNTHLLGPILSHQDAKVYIDVFWKTTSNWKSFVGGGFNSFKFHSYLGR